MRGVNKVTLLGNLGRDPEIHFSENNIPMARFTLATTETYRDKNGQVVSQTEWHHIVLWRGLAEFAQKYLHKGNHVYLEGKIRSRHWDDKEGNRKQITEIVADNLILLDKKTEDSGFSHAGDAIGGE
jgi:single-strand DNA-binding protein